MDDIRILLTRINDFLGVSERFDYPVSALLVFIGACVALIALGLIARGLAGIRDILYQSRYQSRTSAIGHPDDDLLPHKAFAGQAGVDWSSNCHGSRACATARAHGARLYPARSRCYQVNAAILRQASQKIGSPRLAGPAGSGSFVGIQMKHAPRAKLNKTGSVK